FEIAAKGRDAKLAAHWGNNELFGRLNKDGIEISASPVAPERLGELGGLISDDGISGKIAKDVFEKMFETGDAPAAIVEREGLQQITDTGAIEAVIDQLILENPAQAEQVREKPKTMGWFVGQAMKATGGKANPAAVNEILRR